LSTWMLSCQSETVSLTASIALQAEWTLWDLNPQNRLAGFEMVQNRPFVVSLEGNGKLRSNLFPFSSSSAHLLSRNQPLR
jgi:hypothetical protein